MKIKHKMSHVCRCDIVNSTKIKRKEMLFRSSKAVIQQRSCSVIDEQVKFSIVALAYMSNLNNFTVDHISELMTINLLGKAQIRMQSHLTNHA